MEENGSTAAKFNLQDLGLHHSIDDKRAAPIKLENYVQEILLMCEFLTGEYLQLRV